MPRIVRIIFFLLALVTAVLSLPAPGRSADDPYSIIRPEPGKTSTAPLTPEPWLAPKYRSPRGTRKGIDTPRPTKPKAATPKVPAAPSVPPPIVVPDTGRVLPNLPTISPSGPGGTETFQDRAARCAHQAGVYGEATGNRNAYIGTCVNQ